MTPIRTNKPLFFNLDGEPLNGKIYIGQPNADPRTSPKTVTFRDSGGSEFTAKQPLETVDGRVVYNGKPIVHLIDGEYSLLMFDSAGTQVDYTPSIAPASGSGGAVDFSEVTRVGLTLDEIKAFDVSVGETVRNVGNTSAIDGDGSYWLAVSNTGTPGDDETLLDFANGLQGRVIQSQPYYERATVELGGDFTSGLTLDFQRVGDFVFVSSRGEILTTTAAEGLAQSDVGIVPAAFRPSSAAVEFPGITNKLPPYTMEFHSYGITSDGNFSASTVTGEDIATNTNSTNTAFGRVSGSYSI